MRRNRGILLYGPGGDPAATGPLASLPGLIGAYDFAARAAAVGAGNAITGCPNDAPSPGLADLSTGSAPTARNLGASGWVAEFDGAANYLQAAFLTLSSLGNVALVARLAVRDNVGSYKGFLSCRAGTDTDYLLGFTAAMGPTAQSSFNFLVCYGPGATAIPGTNQLPAAVPFDTFCTLSLVRDATAERFEVRLDGVPGTPRSFSGGGSCDAGTLYVGGRGSGVGVADFSSLYLSRLLICASALAGADLAAAETLVESGW